MNETLPKSERLSGQSGVSALFSHGKGLSSGCLRCKYLPRNPAPSKGETPDQVGGDVKGAVLPVPTVMPGPDRASAALAPDASASRIVVSVPKRLFKRAVKRNLLKRRIREAYRRQKGLLSAPVDILFIYAAPEVLPYEVIYADMTAVLRKIQTPENQKDE